MLKKRPLLWPVDVPEAEIIFVDAHLSTPISGRRSCATSSRLKIGLADKELRRYLGEVFPRLALQKELRVEEGHLMPGHVHMLLSIPPKHAVSQVVGYIKGKSAIHLARVCGERKRNFVRAGPEDFSSTRSAATRTRSPLTFAGTRRRCPPHRPVMALHIDRDGAAQPILTSRQHKSYPIYLAFLIMQARSSTATRSRGLLVHCPVTAAFASDLRV